MSNIIGIDLGTTYSVIAYLNEAAKSEVIPNSEGERITPSVIFFDKGNSTPIIGQEAKNSAVIEPNRVAKEFKRKMNDDKFRFKVDDKKYTASDLSAMVLKRLATEASKTKGNIKDAVITVPAAFKEKQRKATMDAGKSAGLNVLGIINEPTAAAIYYANTQKTNGTVLVYDFGGGTFDATILKIKGEEVEIIASAGDINLGGVDFDNAILTIMEEKYKKAIGKNLYDETGKQGFLLDAEKLKKSLSKKSSIKEVLKGDNGKTTIEITQDEFNAKISSHISRSELLVEQVCDEAKIKPTAIDYILLVGGSTRVPAISKSIKNLTGKEPTTTANVDEAIALGAAIYAGLIMIKENPAAVSDSIKANLNNTKVTDVTNHSYGTISRGVDEKLQQYILTNSIIIKKNTPLPCSETETFYTAVEGQEAIEIKITQGEGDDPDFVDKIHTENMQLPPNRPENQPIKFTYSYDANQMMHCIFEDVESGETKEISLSMNKSISSDIDDIFFD
jgi:molecular chaperone DnaK